MKKNLLLNSIVLIFCLHFNSTSFGQGIPDLLYYKFDNAGSDSFPNLASNPPSGTSFAKIYGGISQGSSGTCGGTALVGTGTVSTTDYVNTRWATNTSGSWTVSFWSSGLDSSTNLFYFFSDITATSAGPFRCFTGGVAGAGNSMMRGPFPNNVGVPGGASKKPSVTTFVYDATTGYIYAYFNGALVNSVSEGTITLSSTGSLMLYGYNSLAGLNNGALMDEFRFYTRALTAKEVARLLYYGKTYATIDHVVCGASSYKSPSGKYTWTTPGTYTDTILNYGYCDSFMTIKLSFSNHSSATINPVACDYYVSPSKNFVWTKTGIYTDKIKNKGGCDSNLTINLTIKNSSTSLIKPSACGSYTCPSGKYTWTVTGKYYDTIPNKKGCDSLITIELKVGYANAATHNIKECDRYKSPSGKNTWTISGKYTDIIPNSMGCDSVLTINLTIIKGTSKSFSVKACNKYISPSGKINWVVSGTYMDTIPNRVGCDSVLTINLALNKSSSSQINPNTCGSYISPSGKYTFNFTTSFFDTIPNKSGCDSIILVYLTVNKIDKVTVSRTACKQFVSPSKKHIWTVSGKYVDTTINRFGCDSIVTVNLTINSANVAVTQKNTTLTALADGASYQWLLCNSNYAKITGATNQVYVATTLGKYAVEVNDGQCTDTSVCLDVTDLRIVNNNLNNYLSVYPNPASGQFTVSSAKPLNNATIKIINTIGEKVLQKNNVNGSTITLDISGQANGIYFIEISENDNSGRVKLIKY